MNFRRNLRSLILTLVLLISVTSAYSQFDDPENRRSFAKKSYFMDKLDRILPSSFQHYFRPFAMFFTDLTNGLVHGFTNYNLDLPLYCFADAPSTLQAYFEINDAYKATGDYDIYVNTYDVMLPLELNCNPLTIGGGILSSLYVLFPDWIKKYTTIYGQELIYFFVIAGAFPNFIFSMQNISTVS